MTDFKEEFKCKFCERLFDEQKIKSYRSHQAACKLNPDRNLAKVDYSKKTNSNQYIKARMLGKPDPISSQKGKPGKGTPHTEEFKQKQRVNALKNGLGGVRKSKRVKYKDKSLGSSYELKIAQDLDRYEIRWDTCGKFNYIDPTGKERTYTPDIYLIDYDVYLDPKNDFLLNNINPKLGFKDREKIELVMQQNGIKVLVLDKYQLCWEEIKKILK